MIARASRPALDKPLPCQPSSSALQPSARTPLGSQRPANGEWHVFGADQIHESSTRDTLLQGAPAPDFASLPIRKANANGASLTPKYRLQNVGRTRSQRDEKPRAPLRAMGRISADFQRGASRFPFVCAQNCHQIAILRWRFFLLSIPHSIRYYSYLYLYYTASSLGLLCPVFRTLV